MTREDLRSTGSDIHEFTRAQRAKVKLGVNDQVLISLVDGQLIAIVGGDLGSDLHVGRFWAPVSEVREVPRGLRLNTPFPYWSNFQMLKELGRAMLRIARSILATQRVDVWFDASALWFAGQDKVARWFAKRIPLGVLLEHQKAMKPKEFSLSSYDEKSSKFSGVQTGFSLVEVFAREHRVSPETASLVLDASVPSAHDTLMCRRDNIRHQLELELDELERANIS